MKRKNIPMSFVEINLEVNGFVAYSTITNEALRKYIDGKGVPIYQKAEV
jgi:hypothetical protein